MHSGPVHSLPAPSPPEAGFLVVCLAWSQPLVDRPGRQPAAQAGVYLRPAGRDDPPAVSLRRLLDRGDPRRQLLHDILNGCGHTSMLGFC